MRRVAMIPARLKSTRVPRKNLRMLGDKPLLAWVVESARDSGLFDRVVVNSEAEEIGQLARSLGVEWYRREASLSVDAATSHHFVTDFFSHTLDVVFQITPTSPFLTSDEYREAVRLVDHGAETVLSVRRVQAECVVRGEAVNFIPERPMVPSQNLEPVYVLCNGIFAWRRESFLRYGCYGSSSRKFLWLEGDAAIDIDTEADFADAELVIVRRRSGPVVPRYWTPEMHVETNAAVVAVRDGVSYGVFDMPAPIMNLDRVLSMVPADRSFAYRVVQSLTNSATVIAQLPGEGNRRHYHPDVDEWWLILEGQYDIEIDGVHLLVSKGDVVLVERGKWHQIINCGSSRATRLAVSRDAVAHVYRD